jgi:hypothetical protein
MPAVNMFTEVNKDYDPTAHFGSVLCYVSVRVTASGAGAGQQEL